MKVIKEGSWKIPWEKEVKCGEASCGAVLLADEKDVKPVDYSSRYDDYYVICPICGASIDVPAKDLPLRVRRVLDAKRKHSSSWD